MSTSTKQKILIVDDEPDILELIEYNLKKEGYQVYTARNGQEAVSEAKKVLPDLIVLDIMMPKMDGITFVLRVRATDKKTPLIMVTTEGEKSRILGAIKAGINNYIIKPFTPEILLDKVHQTLLKVAVMKPTDNDMPKNAAHEQLTHSNSTRPSA